ncbi:hypothetical protein EDC01DRAFT_784294 [Geopyxis carbonaria]|nr:hypothetical protein EDC01DRAFT_784294 [Geopyxis carbonaria]
MSSEMLPMELMWVCFPTQTPRFNLPTEKQRVEIRVDHANGGIQLRSLSGALVGWVDPFDDARAMKALNLLETSCKGGRIGGIITGVTVGWPSSGPRLHPAEGQLVMRLLKKGQSIFHGDPEEVAAKAKALADLKAKGTMPVKSGKAIKATKGVAGGRIVKKAKGKPKPKAKVTVVGAVAGFDTGKGNEKGEERAEKQTDIPEKKEEK